MIKIGNVIGGKYEGGEIYEVSPTEFIIKYKGEKTNLGDLRPNPKYDINISFGISRSEAFNLGVSIGMGGFLGLMNFNGLNGAGSYTVRFEDGYSDFEIENLRDNCQHFHRFLSALWYYENRILFWSKLITPSDYYTQQIDCLYDYLYSIKKEYIEDWIEHFEDYIIDGNYIANNKYYSNMFARFSILKYLNYDMDTTNILGGADGIKITEKMKNARSQEEVENIFIDFMPSLTAKEVEGERYSNMQLEVWIKNTAGVLPNIEEVCAKAKQMNNCGEDTSDIFYYVYSTRNKFLLNLINTMRMQGGI